MLRGFIDSTGVEWRVWEVLPSTAGVTTSVSFARTSLRETPFANGWLCFECETCKKRLAPIPEGWDSAAAEVLAELCVRATDVPQRRRKRAS